MTSVMQLALKFAEKTQEKVYQDFYSKFRSLLNEMEGDILTLKIKELDKNTLRVFIGLWKDLLEVFKSMDPETPYQGAQKLVALLNSKTTQNLIEKLNSQIQKHLASTQVDFAPFDKFMEAQVNSLTQLFPLLEAAQDYLNNQYALSERIVPENLPSTSQDLTNPDLARLRPGFNP